MANRVFSSLWERVTSKVTKLDDTNENGCWLFLARLDKDGYGRINLRVDGRHVTKRTHQVLWEQLYGPLPEGMTLDHLDCIGKACCNPDHLELVTRAENVSRRWRRYGAQM